jgi:predicted deacylase
MDHIKVIKPKFILAFRHLKDVPKRYWYIILSGLGVGFIIFMFWPQQLTFSYDQPTCIYQPHLAPASLGINSKEFNAESSSILKVGVVSVVAKDICFSPLTAPTPGDYRVAMALPGLPFINKIVIIHVPGHPQASAMQLKEPVSVSKKLIVALSSQDLIFTYRLTIGVKSIDCYTQPFGVGCDIEKLDLKQGSKYTLQLDRYFKGKKIASVLTTEISTLSAVTLLSSTIKEGETVYIKPKSLTMQFDKPISNMKAIFVHIIGEKREIIPVRQEVKEKDVVLTWSDDLARQQSYGVTFEHVEASDGSTLATPSSINFKTSGGPQVKSISVGTYKVSLGAVVSLMFDQPLSEQQDISKIITATGGARITGRQSQGVTISFANVPRCGDVTIKVTDDLKSNYDVSGGSTWQYTTRTICQSVFSIGTSVNGRSITAYSFGSGSKKVVYTGAIHGDEVSTRSLMLRWVDALEASPRSIPTDKTVIIIPAINPDGYAAGTRTNSHNVDLNRNFNTGDWQSDITTTSNQPFPGGGGSAPLSEPESIALANYIAAIHPTLVISYHSIGSLVIANQAGNSLLLSQRYAALSGYGNATGSSTTFEYTVSGTADDYYAEKLGVASILVELGSHTYHQFDRNQQAMWTMLRET